MSLPRHPAHTLAAWGLLGLLVLNGCQATDINRPTIWPVAGGVSQPVPAESISDQAASRVQLVRGPAPLGWQVRPLAIVDSIAGRESDPGLVARQEADLRLKAARLGATAVVEVRTESIRTKGFERDPNTPFPAWRLGDGRRPFLRGLAIQHSGKALTGPMISALTSSAAGQAARPEALLGGLSNIGQ